VKDYRQKKEKLSVEAYVHVETAAWSELNVFGFRGLLINVKKPAENATSLLQVSQAFCSKLCIVGCPEERDLVLEVRVLLVEAADVLCVL
jgi:hypothetical protein